MEIKKYYAELSKNTFKYFDSKKIELLEIFKHIISNKSEILSSENPTEFIVIIYSNGKFFITDRMLKCETGYIIKPILDSRNLASIKITDSSGIEFFEIDFVKQITRVSRKLNELNVLNIVELFETIFRGFNIELKQGDKNTN